MLCLHVVYSTVHSREIMDSLIMAKYCRCILTLYLFLFCCVYFSGETTFIMVMREA